MKKAVVIVLVVLGVLFTLAVVGTLGLWAVAALGKPSVPKNVVLEIDFEDGVIEAVPEDPLAQLLMEDVLTVRDVVDALDRGAEDKRVKGVVARIAGGMGLAHLQEIRDAVERFRAAGKPAVAYAETFGEFSAGNGAYYLASAFDEIYLQPSGDVGLTGLMYETMFARDLLDKLDVKPRIGQRKEYKNAPDMYLSRGYSGPHREAMQRLVDSQFDQIVRGIAAARDLSPEEVRSLADRAPLLSREAFDSNLVDGLLYRDEVFDHVRELAGEDVSMLFIQAYLDRASRPHRRGTTVALIQGYGAVVRGASSYSAIDGSVSMGSDTVARAIRAAVDDRRVRAIVLRVDSPGGSYVASDTIWRETVRAREAGKPVIVSMGNLAASGGYFVSMSADRIVAQPGTITGSIGVYGGKLVTSGMWEKIGVRWDDVRSSANADHWTPDEDYSEFGASRLDAMLDHIYEDFTRKVAQGRELPIGQVLEIARGRIWTGEDALERGLVDALGGIDVALDEAREALGLEEDAPLRIRRFPRQRSTLDLLFGVRPDNSERAALGSALRSLQGLQPLVRVLRQAGLFGDDRGALSMQELRLNE